MDDKIIAVCADDPEYKHFTDIKQLAPHRLSEIRRFFEDCNLLFFIYKIKLWKNKKKQYLMFSLLDLMLVDKKNEHKEVAVNDFLPSEKAHEAIQYSM